MRPLPTLLLLGILFTNPAFGWEISLVSGLFHHEEYKTAGADTGGKSEFTLGARVAELVSPSMHWYSEGIVVHRTFESAPGIKTPDDKTSLVAKGGVRYYFFEFSDKVAPFLAAAGGYGLYKDASVNDNIQTERSGVYYWGYAGLRFDASRDVFFEFEMNMFESALYETQKSKAIDDTAQNAPKSKETTSNDLYVDSTASASTARLIAGIKL